MRLTANDIASHHMHLTHAIGLWKDCEAVNQYEREKKKKVNICMKRFVKTFGTNEEQKKFMGKNYE